MSRCGVGLLRRVRDDERGTSYVAAFLVLFTVVVVAAAGLLIDSARMFAADRQCSATALEAARAAANELEQEILLSGSGVNVEPGRAQAAAYRAASTFVSASGLRLDSVSVNGNRVTVVVSSSVGSWYPLLGDRTVTERATAEATLGTGS